MFCSSLREKTPSKGRAKHRSLNKRALMKLKKKQLTLADELGRLKSAQDLVKAGVSLRLAASRNDVSHVKLYRFLKRGGSRRSGPEPRIPLAVDDIPCTPLTVEA